jgi:hypothetical protein
MPFFEGHFDESNLGECHSAKCHCVILLVSSSRMSLCWVPLWWLVFFWASFCLAAFRLMSWRQPIYIYFYYLNTRSDMTVLPHYSWLERKTRKKRINLIGYQPVLGKFLHCRISWNDDARNENETYKSCDQFLKTIDLLKHVLASLFTTWRLQGTPIYRDGHI